MAARAVGVAAVFTLSAFVGFGTEPTAQRPAQIKAGFEPRPYAMAYAVREAVAQRRADRQFDGVVAALDGRADGEPEVPVVAYRADTDEGDGLDRFDAFVGGTLALAETSDASVPLPIMRPVGARAPRP